MDVLISCSLYLYMSGVRLSLLSFLRSGLYCLRVNLPNERPNFRQYLGNKTGIRPEAPRHMDSGTDFVAGGTPYT